MGATTSALADEPAAQGLDPLPQLLAAGLRHLRAAAGPAQLGVHGGVRLRRCAAPRRRPGCAAPCAARSARGARRSRHGLGGVPAPPRASAASASCCGLPLPQQRRSPGRARAGRGCRGSPAPRRCRPRPRCRTPACRTAPGRRSPAPPAPRTPRRRGRRRPSPRGWPPRAGRPRASTPSSSSLRRPVEGVVALDLQLGGEARAAPARWAGRSTPSPRAAGPGRTGRRPGRRTAGWTSRWRRRPTASRGTSTPSETIRTATIQRCSPSRELLDPVRGGGVVGQHHDRRLAADVAQDLGVGAGRRSGRSRSPARRRPARRGAPR